MRCTWIKPQVGLDAINKERFINEKGSQRAGLMGLALILLGVAMLASILFWLGPGNDSAVEVTPVRPPTEPRGDDLVTAGDLSATPAPGPPAVENAAHVKQLAQLGKGTISKVAYAPDGQMLAVASSLGVYLYDAATLAELQFIGARDEIMDLAFSPDGQTLAGASREGAVYLWRVRDGTLLRTLIGHRGMVFSVAFAPDGQSLASGSIDDSARLWRVSDGTLLHTLEGHTSYVNDVAFSPDGQILATASVDSTLRLWRVEDGTPLRTLAGHTHRANSVAFAPDGQILASGAQDRTVRLWRVDECAPVLSPGDVPSSPAEGNLSEGCGAPWHTLEGHTAEVLSVAFSPDGQSLASASLDKTVRLWRVSDGTLLRTLEGHTGWLNSVAFAPDGQTLASGSDVGDNTARLWRVSDGTLLHTLEGHTSNVYSIAFTPDGQVLAAAGPSDDAIWLWRVGECAPVLSPGDVPPSPAAGCGSLLRKLEGHKWHTLSMALSPDGQILATGSLDEAVRLWQVGECTLVVSPSETSLPPGCGTLLHTLEGHTRDVYGLAFSPDGQVVASGAQDGTVRLWQVSDGAALRTLEGHAEMVTSIAFAPGGQTLAAGSLDGTVQLWQVHEGTLLRTLEGHTSVVSSVAFAPDGQSLASSSLDKTVRLWRASDGVLLRTLQGHPGGVIAVAFSPDGQILASGGSRKDKAVRLWRVSDGVLLRTLEGHTDSLTYVAFSPDGQILASASHDGTVRLWDISTVYGGGEK